MSYSAKVYSTRDEEKKRRSNNGGSFVGNSSSSSKSWLEAWEEFEEFQKTHELRYPLQDYLEGTKAGEFVDWIVGALDKYDKEHVTPADVFGKTAAIIGDYFNKGVSAVGSAIGNFLGNSPASSQSGVSAKPIVYSDWSPASKFFGMSQDTAFNEHMANTAHQREVMDLKAAGLNPVLGISGSGATSVSGNAGVGSSSAEKAQDFPYMDVLGATAGLITALVSKKPALGYMVANVFKSFD